MNDLRILGFTDQESRTYLHLLEQGPKSVLDLAATLGMDARDVRKATDALIDIGMAISSSTGDTVITPINPHAALERLTHEKNSELLRSVMATESAYTAYLRHVQIPAHNEPNEILTGPQIIVRIRQMERMAAKEVLRLDSPPYFTGGAPNPEEIENLEKRITYRVVYSKAAVENTCYYDDNICPSIAAGEEARVLPEVPVKMTIFDRRVAFISLSTVDADTNRSMLVVHHTALLRALTGLFEHAWRASFPMHMSGARPSPLRPVQRRALELLCTGMTDQRIAEHLSISRRTLSRNVEQLLSLAGATTRFQLAVHASRCGWL